MDIKIDNTGDIQLEESGDIVITNSIRQAVLIHLKWIFDEWRLGPELGFPWFEEVFVKDPDLDWLRTVFRAEIMKVDGVTDAEVTNIEYDPGERRIKLYFRFSVGEEQYREEVELYG